VRRFVTFQPEFFQALDRQLPVARGESTPSRQDFLEYELTALRETFGDHWDELPTPHPGRGDYRTVILPGRVVYAYTATAQLASNGTVQVIDIELDLAWPQDPDGD